MIGGGAEGRSDRADKGTLLPAFEDDKGALLPAFRIMKPTRDLNKSFYQRKDRVGALSSAPTLLRGCLTVDYALVKDWARARALSTSDYSLHSC